MSESKSPTRLRQGLTAALACALTALGAVSAVGAPPPAVAQGPTLTGEGLMGVVPAVSSFTPQDGASPFVLTASTRVVIADPADEASLRQEAELLSGELGGLSAAKGLALTDVAPVVVGQAPQAGDVVLDLQDSVEGLTTSEGYRMEVAPQHLTITATGDAGAFYGTRTLLQSLTTSGGLQAGQVVDQPVKAVRSLHVDAARKYFSPGWFKEQIHQMSWVKLNQIQYHFSENEGFRLESKTHPEIVSDQHITQEELAEIIAEASKYHIEVVPALDVPGHMRHVLSKHPEWAVSQSEAGRKILDYSKPEVRGFVEELINEYAPLFPSTTWHMGGDEAFPIQGNSYYPSFHSDMARQFPSLKGYADQVTGLGQAATVQDGYTHYLNEVAHHLQAQGKTSVRAWNDAIDYQGTSVTLDPSIDVAYWTNWHGAFPTVQALVDKGHKVINFNDSVFYYVLSVGAYADKPTAQKVYAWSPGQFPWRHGASQASSDADKQLWSPSQDWETGASLAVWCDGYWLETEEQVAAGIKPLLRAMASRLWSPQDTTDFATWDARQHKIGDSPEPLEPLGEVSASLELVSEPATGSEVSPGQVLSRTVTLGSDAPRTVPASVAVDLSALGSRATLSSTPSAQYLDAQGNPLAQDPGSNVALGRPVTASGQEAGTTWSKDKVVDGATTGDSRWSSNYSDQAWIAVELAEPTTVDHVSLVWEAACAPSFEIMTSTDGATWTSATGVLTQTCPPEKLSAERRSHTLSSAGPVRFVKVQAHSRQAFGGSYYGVSLWELEVWDGPEEGVSTPQPVLDTQAGTISWNGPLPQGHSLRLSWQETVSPQAADGAVLDEHATGQAGPSEPVRTGATHTVRVTSPQPEPDPGQPEGTMPAYVAAVVAGGSGQVLMGDWDGDGALSYAVRVGSRVVFYNDNHTGAPVYAAVSIGRAGDEVLVGDWDGDGRDTLALRRGAKVMTQDVLTSTRTTKVVVEGLTRSSTLKVVPGQAGAPDTLVVG